MKTSDIRENIVKTASALFYRNGYNSTGINEIIRESGIAKATLYNHFKSKEDLCLSYLKYMNNNFLNNIKEYCYSKPDNKLRVLSIFDFLDKFFLDKEFNGCWCIKTISEIPKDNKNIRKEIQNQKNEFINFIRELAISNIKAESIQDQDSKIRQIYLLYESAVAESQLHQKNWPIKEAKTICSQII